MKYCGTRLWQEQDFSSLMDEAEDAVMAARGGRGGGGGEDTKFL